MSDSDEKKESPTYIKGFEGNLQTGIAIFMRCLMDGDNHATMKRLFESDLDEDALMGQMGHLTAVMTLGQSFLQSYTHILGVKFGVSVKGLEAVQAPSGTSLDDFIRDRTAQQELRNAGLRREVGDE